MASAHIFPEHCCLAMFVWVCLCVCESVREREGERGCVRDPAVISLPATGVFNTAESSTPGAALDWQDNLEVLRTHALVMKVVMASFFFWHRHTQVSVSVNRWYVEFSRGSIFFRFLRPKKKDRAFCWKCPERSPPTRLETTQIRATRNTRGIW